MDIILEATLYLWANLIAESRMGKCKMKICIETIKLKLLSSENILSADTMLAILGNNNLAADRIRDVAGWNTPTAERVPATNAEILRRPTEYAMLQDGALRRPREYLLQMRKYSDGRQSTSAVCANIVTADRVLDATGRSTTTADRVHNAIGRNTLTAVRVLATMDEAL